MLLLNHCLFERCSVQTMLVGQLPSDLSVGEPLSCKLNANPNNGNVSNDDQSFMYQNLLQVISFMPMQLSALLCMLLMYEHLIMIVTSIPRSAFKPDSPSFH